MTAATGSAGYDQAEKTSGAIQSPRIRLDVRVDDMCVLLGVYLRCCLHVVVVGGRGDGVLRRCRTVPVFAMRDNPAVICHEHVEYTLLLRVEGQCSAALVVGVCVCVGIPTVLREGRRDNAKTFTRQRQR